MKDEKEVTITDEEFDYLKNSIMENIPLGVKVLVYGRDIPADMRLPNGMNFEEFKEKVQEDVDKTLESVKSTCEMQGPQETDFKSIGNILGRMRTAVLNDVALKELFWEMAKVSYGEIKKLEVK